MSNQLRSVIDIYTLQEIQTERFRQHDKFGHEHIATPEQMGLILGEEYGEICRAICQNADPIELRKVVVQLAAVCIAWLDGDLHWGEEK